MLGPFVRTADRPPASGRSEAILSDICTDIRAQKLQFLENKSDMRNPPLRLMAGLRLILRLIQFACLPYY